jgi:peroxiredoxin family protein
MAAKNSVTLINESGTYDGTAASLIIANGAAAMGMDVSIFFTFWGLNVVKKGGLKKLPLSRMNMGGMGRWMIKSRMKKNNVQSLDELMADAMDLGVRFIACDMTMIVMNVPEEKLIDNVEVGGIGTMLVAAKESAVTYYT